MQRHYVRLRRLVYSSWRLPWGPASQAHRSSSYWPSPRLDFSVRASIQISLFATTSYEAPRRSYCCGNVGVCCWIAFASGICGKRTYTCTCTRYNVRVVDLGSRTSGRMWVVFFLNKKNLILIDVNVVAHYTLWVHHHNCEYAPILQWRYQGGCLLWRIFLSM